MSFVNQQPFVLDKELHKFLLKRNLCCGICGDKLQHGDIIRWNYMGNYTFVDEYTGKQWGETNFFVCKKCDNGEEKVSQKRLELRKEYIKLNHILECND